MYIAFDFGYKRIGMAVGQGLTCSASPLPTLNAKAGVPNWADIAKVLAQWQPEALIVGLPTTIAGESLYTTKAAKRFAKQLQQQFNLPVHLVDERLTTTAAREQVFATGGYRKLKKTPIDGIAACIILEHWLTDNRA
jgi:putative Holliday junction resolvase